MSDSEADRPESGASVDPELRAFLISEIEARVQEAGACLDRIREGEQSALAEMKQFWHRLKGAGTSYGVPGITVLGAAFEALSEAWQRARVGGREHPDTARLTQEAIELLPALARGEVPRGSGILKDLCVRASDLTRALARCGDEAKV